MTDYEDEMTQRVETAKELLRLPPDWARAWFASCGSSSDYTWIPNPLPQQSSSTVENVDSAYPPPPENETEVERIWRITREIAGGS